MLCAKRGIVSSNLQPNLVSKSSLCAAFNHLSCTCETRHDAFLIMLINFRCFEWEEGRSVMGINVCFYVNEVFSIFVWCRTFGFSIGSCYLFRVDLGLGSLSLVIFIWLWMWTSILWSWCPFLQGISYHKITCISSLLQWIFLLCS
jgi:hypothetical protein